MTAEAVLSDADRATLVELYARYTHAFDEGRADELSELFTADGQFLRPGAEPVQGRMALAAMVRAAADRSTGNRHLVSAVVVETGPDDRALGRAYVQVVSGTVPFQPVAFGRYDDEFAVEDGRWRIRARSFVPFPPPAGS